MKTLNDKLSEILNDGNIFDSDKIRKAINITNFGNQPFDVGMLVNQHEKYIYKQFETDKNHEYIIDRDNPEWQQAEQLRYFEGWRLATESGDNWYDCKDGFICFEKDFIIINTFIEREHHKPQTLNDFITLCNLAGITLEFNKQNQTIINLNLE